MKKQLRAGLHVKAMLVMAVVVLSSTIAAAWLYYAQARDLLWLSDRQQADRLVAGVALAAGPSLDQPNRAELQRLCTSLLNYPSVHYVRIVDRQGQLMGQDQRVRHNPYVPVYQPVSLAYEQAFAPHFLELGRPVLIGNANQPELVGMVQIVVDTSQTSEVLARMGRQAIVIAGVVTLLAVSVGYLLVWRMLVMPAGRLVRATRLLADGDYSARAQIIGNDEIGELAVAFNVMADRIEFSRQQLLEANVSLEAKVAERTSQLEQANRRLREEMTEKEEFLRAVSHDLNAPLRNINGMASMILTKWPDLPDDAKTRLGRIQANVKVQADMINELLELARIRTRPMKREWVAMGEVFTELRAAFEYELKQKQITLTLQPPMPCLLVERPRMRQLFQNLIDNAIKYMTPRADARIDIACRIEQGRTLFSVADNGPGISAQDQERVFCVFGRGSATAQIAGKGVGLATVRAIAANYEGRVRVESMEGYGSTFFVELASGVRGPGETPAAGMSPALRTVA